MAERDPLLLAIDVGTGSARAAALTSKGRILALGQRTYEQEVPRPGWSEQAPESWWQSVVEALREVLAAPEVDARRIAALAACGQMHGPVPIDAEGRVLLERVQLWNDKRPAELVERFAAGRDVRALAARTANPPAASWIGFKLAWMRAHQPEAYERAATFLVPKDFINFRLTGARATDLSEASGSYLLDCRTLAYDPALGDALGVEVGKLAPIRPAAEVIGAITRDAAAKTGLVEGTPVVAGGGDFLVALLGSGVVEPGVGSDITGTSTLISVLAERPALDPLVMNLHSVDGGWVPFTLIDAGGDSMRWARRTFHDAATDFEAINALAAASPAGAEGLLFLPYLSGERLGRPHARAQLFGISARHGKGHFDRAVMEGVAFASRRNLDVMARAGARFERLIATGGGARGELWLRIKACVYDLPIATPETAESGLLGCAALAGIGAGVFADAPGAVRRLVRLKAPIMPDPPLVERYARLKEIFDDLYEASRAFDQRLAGM